ncbi:MMPL family transporter [Streptomyces sp. BE20]|uniref:MMPL family transporter n=1 Tax=Streptomycetaceae TaxID=2062 RepID=UPI002E79ADD7|nr:MULTISPECIES: MMPL family transporter [unclassified Streptomyces]MED7954232.1 MMPL family transporter [Streptomyces sp. BE303]MEE1825714.1 MMPL family transporter [Streptomyces sp. BE20]
MFHRLGHFVVRRAWWVIAAWVIAMIAIAASAPKITAQTDEASFLPKHYESIQASVLQEKAFPANFTPSALALFERNDGAPMDASDKDAMAKIVQGLTDKKIEHVEKIVPASEQSTSKDGKYALAPIAIDKATQQSDEFGEAAKKLRDEGKSLTSGTNLKFQLGGAAAQALDQKESSGAADAVIALATLVLVVIIVGIIFRSVLAGLLPIVVSLIIAMPAANGLIAYATKAFKLESTPVLSAILIVVVLGVGTDYFLFLAFRYRERLRAGDDRKEAVANAVGRVGEAIASAAGAVTVAFAVLILSSLGMFKALGPALAIAVVVTAFASLTLAPALLAVIPARAVFWPGKKWMNEPKDARFLALGRLVQKRPALVAVASGGVLLALSAGALGYNGTFDLAGSSMPKDKESMVVQDKLVNGFSAGAADPSHVYLTTTGGGKLDAGAFEGFAAKLGGVPGVATAASKPQLSEDGATADFTVLLKNEPSSNEAIDTLTKLREVAHAQAPGGTETKVGGLTAVYKDINLAMSHDYKLVFPIAGLLILLILGLQLRSVVAPWYLMASVGLGFTATLGSSTLLFQNIKGEHGIMFMLPILIYLFVVAIGTDYNILIIARLREEAREGRSPREAAREALRHGGPTVAAAGFILAASFGTFMLAGNIFMLEFGFAMAFGIILAAFVMAMFFTPALTALIGRAAWWPGHGDAPGAGHAPVGGAQDAHGLPEAAGRR